MQQRGNEPITQDRTEMNKLTELRFYIPLNTK